VMHWATSKIAEWVPHLEGWDPATPAALCWSDSFITDVCCRRSLPWAAQGLAVSPEEYGVDHDTARRPTGIECM